MFLFNITATPCGLLKTSSMPVYSGKISFHNRKKVRWKNWIENNNICTWQGVIILKKEDFTVAQLHWTHIPFLPTFVNRNIRWELWRASLHYSHVFKVQLSSGLWTACEVGHYYRGKLQCHDDNLMYCNQKYYDVILLEFNICLGSRCEHLTRDRA
jgi:hypothetical protein